MRGIKESNGESSDHAVVFLAGFERAIIAEEKFKIMSKLLAEAGLSTYRIDMEGLSLSDGDFSVVTVDHYTNNLEDIIEKLKDSGIKRISLVAHSLGACVVANFISRNPNVEISKMVLIAPALNQVKLQRYWYTKQSNKDIEITWDNFTDYFDEKAYSVSVNQEGRSAKKHWVNPGYFQESDVSNFEPQILNWDLEKVYAVFGGKDDVVPRESVSVEFVNEIIIPKGDHDIEKPFLIREWIDPVVEFLTK